VYGVPPGPVREADSPGAVAPHCAAQRPDHSLPEVLSDDELALAIDTLRRKRDFTRRMLAAANAGRRPDDRNQGRGERGPEPPDGRRLIAARPAGLHV